MCGLAGLLVVPGSAAPDRLTRAAVGMAEALAHRGPDGAGHWVDAAAGVALAHRRLAILDLTAAGDQPMVSADGRFRMVYNGEVYNHAALRAHLQGHRFRGHCDAETLLEAITRDGLEETLQRIDGMFALALWDTRERVLWLARDRYGEKPLYYASTPLGMAFCSELHALHTLPDASWQVDRDVVAAYLRHGCVPQPHSIFTEVRSLAPGHLLALRPGTPAAAPDQARPFWQAETIASRTPRVAMAPEAAVERIEAVLRRGVRERLHADVPVGVFLSGGVDSSTVAALAAAESASPVRTFTVAFEEAGFDESVHAAAVARHLGTAHHERRLRAADALALVPTLAEVYDEPFADSSALPTLLIARAARDTVTVCLTGDGGDELFGGYNRHRALPALLRRARRVPLSLRRALAAGLGGAADPRMAALLERVSGCLPRRFRVPQLGDKLGKLGGALGASGLEAAYRRTVSWDPDPCRLVLGAVEPELSMPAAGDLTDPEWLVLADTLRYLPDDVLVKVDRASMHASLETRTPFLDPRLAEVLWSLPSAQRFAPGSGKPLLRAVAARHLPPALLARPKAGFAVPLAAWLRGPLRDWAAALLDARAVREEGLFDSARVTRLWQAHLSGRRNHEHRLWSLLMFRAWLHHTRRLARISL